MERSNFVTQTPIGKILKIFFSETRRPRSLIFGMCVFLVDLYEDCSNYSHGAKNGPAPFELPPAGIRGLVGCSSDWCSDHGFEPCWV